MAVEQLDFRCVLCSIWFCDNQECQQILKKRAAFARWYDDNRRVVRIFVPDTGMRVKYDRRRKRDSPRKQWERQYRKGKRPTGAKRGRPRKETT